MIALTTPLMLLGLGLLALPIIAHLLNRRARQTIVFPSLVLLRASSASQSQLFRLRRWLLLALRVLAVILIVLAFARPLWISAEAANPGQEVGLVVLIDASASTRQETAGVTLAASFAAAAGKALSELSPGVDKANIVFAESRPRAVFSQLSANLPALREELADYEPTMHRADLLPAIALAGKNLAGHSGPKRLVLLSDLQKSNWESTASAAKLRGLLPADVTVTIVEPAEPPPDNVALSEPRVYPFQPLVGQTAQATVLATNHSARAKQVRVSVDAEGKPTATQTIALAPGEQRAVVFEIEMENAGELGVTFSAPDDGLDADNRAFLATQSRGRRQVAVVSDDDPSEPGTGAFFLERALAPTGDPSEMLSVVHIRPGKAAESNLSAFGLVIVGYLGELTEAAAQKLADYVRGGGGLLFFCGEGDVATHLKTLDRAAAPAGLLPWTAERATTFEMHEDGLHITSGKWQSRLLSEFDATGQLALAEIRFHRVWRPTSVRADAQVLMAFEDQTPALASREFGAGKCFLANFSPSFKSSDLAKYGAYVALMQLLARELQASADQSARHVAGEPLPFSTSLPVSLGMGTIEVVDPVGKTIPHTVSRQGDGLSVEIERAETPGIYRVHSGGKDLALAAVQLDRRESDLARLKQVDLARRLERGGASADVHDTHGFSRLTPSRGKSLWGWLLFAGLAAFAAELALVGWWKR